MRTQLEQERLLDDVVRTCFESATLNDLGEKVLPLLDDLLDTSGSLVYQCNKDRSLSPIAGTFSTIYHKYSEEYISEDPIQVALQRLNPKIQRVSLLPEWKSYIKKPIYNEFSHPNQIDDFYHIILRGEKFNEPDMVAIMLARVKEQPQYEEQDGLFLARLYPALQALVQRNARLEARLRTMPLMETMIELQSPLAIALNLKGSLLWASEKAAVLLKLGGKGKNEMPAKLVGAARSLRDLIGKNFASSPPPSSVMFSKNGGPQIRAELRLARTRSGEYFVIAEFEVPLFSPPIKKLAIQFELTATETKVFQLIALGMADRDIAQHLFVSLATVRTHVGRILAKLGVPSRVQAALLAHNLPIHTGQEHFSK